MTSQPFIYRQASLTDLPCIIQLIHVSYQQYQSELSAPNWTSMEANLINKSAYVELMQRATVFTCESNGTLIGVIFLIPQGNPTQIFPADWSYVRLLGVEPTYRGLGIGRQLTQLCIEEARKRGETTLALHTSEFMNQARKMYEQLGFQLVHELAPIYNKRYWLYKLAI